MTESEANALSTLARIRQGKRYTRIGKLPADRLPFQWRVLTGTEKQECVAAALEHFAKLKIPADLRSHQDLEDETSVAAAMARTS